MVLHLAEQLDVPLRERNALLLAAGHAPVFGQRGIDEPEMGPVRDALDAVLRGHEPYPAVVVDRHWGMVAGNRAVALLTEGVAPELLEPPVNVLRLSLHPGGMAPRIANLAEWRAHLLERLGRQAVMSGDPALGALHAELAALPGGGPAPPHDPDAGQIATPLRLHAPGGGVLSFISTITTFGTATDVTVAELSIESFFPRRRRHRGGDARRRLTRRLPPRSSRGHPRAAPSAGQSTCLEGAHHGRHLHRPPRRGARPPGAPAPRPQARRRGHGGQRPGLPRPAGPLSDLLGLDAAFLRAIGAFLLVFAALVWAAGTRSRVSVGAVRAIVAVNVAWVAGSLALAVLGLGSPSTVGTVWAVLQAAVVGAFAELQVAGLRRGR
jgi:hypothetical protein